MRNLRVHLTSISSSTTNHELDKGILLVIEDLTDVVKASKIKTWREAAKQMAHEIKNPLTPIQLATQRLQRKYLPVFSQESTFFDCTNTILNQVKIIKDLSAHFSHFASLPTPLIEQVNLTEVIEEIVRLYELSYPSILFSCHLSNKKITTIKTDKKKKLSRYSSIY